LNLITREDSKDCLTGIHWAAYKTGEPYNHVFTAGLFRARIIFEGDTKKEVQHYYFFAMACRTNDDNIRVQQVIPDEDIGFINKWELSDN
jgi:hypothetical protein